MSQHHHLNLKQSLSLYFFLNNQKEQVMLLLQIPRSSPCYRE